MFHRSGKWPPRSTAIEHKRPTPVVGRSDQRTIHDEWWHIAVIIVGDRKIVQFNFIKLEA
jgi:hypothetical protein